jgi:hypothetical protein
MTNAEIRMEIRAWERAREHERRQAERARADALFALGMAVWVLMLLFPLVTFVFAVIGSAIVGLCTWMWAIS